VVKLRHLPPRREAATRDGERGTSVVEASIVSLAFFTIILMIFEGSFLIQDSLGVSNVVRASARTATVNGDDVLSDFYTLRTVRKEADAIGIDDLQLVVVYEATGYGNPPSTGCKGGTPDTSGADQCNVYRAADLRRPQSDFGCRTAGSSSLDNAWCPNTRKVAESGTGGPPDYLGVYVKYRHDVISGLFSGGSTITDFVVIRMEPRKLS
jgi:hypothetical protein